MLKKRLLLSLVGLRLLVIVGLLLSVIACTPNANRGERVDTRSAISEQDILDIVELVQRELPLATGRKLHGTPKITFMTPDELQKKLIADRPNVNDKKQQYTSLGHYSRSVSAIYDDGDKGIYVVPENIKIYKRKNNLDNSQVYYAMMDVLSHEFVHALQDQEGLLDWDLHGNRSSGQKYAFSALVEGHTAMQTALILDRLNILQDLYDYGTEDEMDTDTLNEERIAFQERMRNKYITGKKFMNRIHKKNGNEKTWSALQNPEESVELLLDLLKSA